jgi:hypothetical protein
MVCQDRKDSRCCGFQGRQREVGGAKWRPRAECLQPSSMRMSSRVIFFLPRSMVSTFTRKSFSRSLSWNFGATRDSPSP